MGNAKTKDLLASEEHGPLLATLLRDRERTRDLVRAIKWAIRNNSIGESMWLRVYWGYSPPKFTDPFEVWFLCITTKCPMKQAGGTEEKTQDVQVPYWFFSATRAPQRHSEEWSNLYKKQQVLLQVMNADKESGLLTLETAKQVLNTSSGAALEVKWDAAKGNVESLLQSFES